jgi:ABC-type sugar transport system ATPase subunit
MNELSVQNIFKRFDGVEVIRSASLAFKCASVTALVGDNGAGKSTLLKLLAGVYVPDSGSIKLGERDITRLSAKSRRGIGIEMVYQDLALARGLNITTNVFMGREKTYFGGFLKKKEMRREAESTLEKLGIKIPTFDGPIGRLSGGQQQAVAIARAILFNPNVLLLDEPTAALAAKEVSNTLELIKMQKAEGRTVILVSHRLQDVMDVADRIVVLKHGSVFSDDLKSSVDLTQIVERIVS